MKVINTSQIEEQNTTTMEKAIVNTYGGINSKVGVMDIYGVKK